MFKRVQDKTILNNINEPESIKIQRNNMNQNLNVLLKSKKLFL